MPRHIAIIMDGNGRWATSKGLPRTAGHSAGSETFRKMAEYLNELGLEYLTVYAFSTENWKRPESEVSAIMTLLEKYLRESVESMARKNIRLKIWGDISVLSPGLRKLIEETDEISRHTTGLQVNVCLNYSGRDDLLRAARQLALEAKNGTLDPDEITRDHISARLYSAGVPDPDLLIRPGREQRISNFLLWQCAYSEFYFTDVLWPDFDEKEMDRAIDYYRHRERRFGGLKGDTK